MLQTSEIQAVAAVAREGSINKAAGVLNTTQPTLSKLLLRLEDRLGGKLFHRSERGMTPTEIGSFLISSSQGVVAELAKIERQVSMMTGTGGGHLRIGVGPIVEELFLVPVLAAFYPLFDGISIEVRTEPADRLLELVQKGEIDLVAGPFEKDAGEGRLTVTPVTEDEIVYVARPDHPLAGQAGPLELAELASHPFITPDTPESIVRQVRQKRHAKAQRRAGRIKCENYATAKALAQRADFIVSAPKALFERELHLGTLVQLNIKPSLIWRCACLARPETLYSRPVQNMVELFVAQGTQIGTRK